MAGVPLDLVSATAFAKAAGWSRAYVHRLAQSGELPPADAMLDTGQRLWLRATLQRWADEQGKQLQWPPPRVD